MILGITENELVTCTLDESLPVLRHRWLQEPTGKQFRQNLLQIRDEYLRLKSSYKSLAWLADTELLGELDPDTETWLVEEWENLLFEEAGVKIHAVILGTSIFADYPMEKFKANAELKYTANNIRLGVFSNQQDAYHWIIQQQQTL